MLEEIVIDAKWHAEKVAERQRWLQHTHEQIEWHLKMIAEHNEYLKVQETWLAEAIQYQKEFEAREARNDHSN